MMQLQHRRHGTAFAAAAAVVALLLGPMLAAAAWHECNSQGVFPGLYGSQAVTK
jgi:hypothetical protein